MSDLFSECCKDEEEYLRLCKIFGEEPRKRKTHRGFIVFDCYGKHSEKLREKYKLKLKNNMNENKIELGDRVADKITGLKGVVVAITKWLYSCTRVSVQVENAKDGKYPDQFTVDEPQLELVKKGVAKPMSQDNGGPSISPVQRPNPTR